MLSPSFVKEAKAENMTETEANIVATFEKLEKKAQQLEEELDIQKIASDVQIFFLRYRCSI